MEDRFQACDSRRLLALMDLDGTEGANRSATFESGLAAPDESVAPQIKGYHITGRLGQGGMGIVWRAMHLATQRPVALKTLSHSSLGTRKARVRFEREIELSARLEHPNVARVYDSGVCGDIEYLAMELVDGIHFDRYARDNRLSHRQILALMRDVSQAVHYAHQRGVIHRDIKPSNILVTADGHPHVVDFGLAKALEGEPGDPTLTQEGQYAGTPAFMAPEQVSGRLNAIDTRTDVYGLGATLYLLLTGDAPHDQSGPRYEVMLRVANEEVRPPRQISKALDAELEAMLLRALAREPERRYGSAFDLSQDIDRYLSGDALKAAPPSRGYRFSKFVRKHRLPVTVAAAFVLLLLGATAVSTWQAIRATRAERLLARERDQVAAEKHRANEQAAEAQAVNDFMTTMLTAPRPDQLLGDKVTVMQVAEQAIKRLDDGTLKEQPLVEATVRDTIGRTLRELGHYDEAETQLRRALELRRQKLPTGDKGIAISLGELAGVLRERGQLREADPLLYEALEISRKLVPTDNVEIARNLNNVAVNVKEQGRIAEAEPLLREALELDRKSLPPGDPSIATDEGNLALLLADQSKIAEAEVLFREALALDRKGLPAGHPTIAIDLGNLSDLLRSTGKLEEAEALAREALDIQRKAFPVGHANIARGLDHLASVLKGRGKSAEAELLYGEALDIVRQSLPPEHPSYLQMLHNLALLLLDEGKLDEAEALGRESLQIRRASRPPGHPDIAVALNALGRILTAQGKLGEAEARYREAVAIYRNAQAKDPVNLSMILVSLGDLLRENGRLEDAERVDREAVDLRRSTLPAGDPFIADSLSALASVLRDEKKYAEAESLCREALEIRRKAMPPGDRHITASMSSLAWVLWDEKKHAEAEPLCRAALDIRRKTLPPGHPDIATSLDDLGCLLQSVGRFAEAEPFLTEGYHLALERRMSAKDAARSIARYGPLLIDLGRYQEAEQPLNLALNHLRATGMDKNHHMRAVLRAMASLCEHTDRPDEAKRWRAELAALEATTRPTPAATPASDTGPMK